ncbi:hypothetical protein F5J12DRAFT_915885 [Pisolithus orientalis]|uniref:uncharacterized protein n=1 Tax=Pisolithus orientalis TaxID=936130 RepID=UPI002224A93C|nr:uncharacterized protein F5J12DRAFT_915885 [Pisolithus orientalis]KAI5988938.1 hypothetical protein F5J12DRAFT_915885 [Pisolithus orientalis]
MDNLPELADDGHNWTAYGSWVLNAIADEGLMGFLLGSETQPIHPAQLKGRGEGWTPQTNEEQDEVTAWQTSDEFWHKQSLKVNLLLIFGISDCIFSFILHLKTPLEKFTYLEKHYGSVTRPESWKTTEEDAQSDNLQNCHSPVLHGAEATSQQTSGSLLGQSATHDNKRDSTELSLETVEVTPSQCRQVEVSSINIPTAEVEHTLNGHLELELEGVPCEAGSGSMDELGDANPKTSSGRADKTSAAGTCSQLVIANVTRDLHLLKPSSETFDLAINSINLENTHAIKTTSQTPVNHDQHIQTCSSLITNIPDLPCIHVAAPNPFIGQSDQVFGTSNTERKLARARTVSNGEITIPHPHEAQTTLSDQAALTNEPKCLKDLQEAE